MATVQVRYIVRDVDAAIEFYTRQLGFTLQMHPAPPFAMVSLGDLRVVLSAPNPRGGGGQPMPDGTPQEPAGWNRFAVQVDNLNATVQALRSAGARFRNDIVTGTGGRQIMVEDPSGNPIELFEPAIPKHGWSSEAGLTKGDRGCAMTPPSYLREIMVGAWRTNSRVTAYLIEHVPEPLWDAAVPGAPRRTVRMMAGHFHNSRSRWIRTLGQEHGIAAPSLVDLRKVTRRALLAALKRSSAGIEALLELGLASGGQVPPSKAYVSRNLPLDVGHVLTYFVAHEAHHRGQIVMLARQLGHRLPREATDGLWQWTTRVREWNRSADR